MERTLLNSNFHRDSLSLHETKSHRILREVCLTVGFFFFIVTARVAEAGSEQTKKYGRDSRIIGAAEI